MLRCGDDDNDGDGGDGDGDGDVDDWLRETGSMSGARRFLGEPWVCLAARLPEVALLPSKHRAPRGFFFLVREEALAPFCEYGRSRSRGAGLFFAEEARRRPAAESA